MPGCVLLSGILLLLGCARAGGPPGGVPDDIPPRVSATRPDTFAMPERPPPHLEIHFDERISERPANGTMDNAVLVSPRTGAVRVRHRRRSLEVSMEGGFRRGVVYQVTLLPVVNDMFGNVLENPFEFFFSTGPDFQPTVLAGLVSDRLTGEPVAGTRLDALPEGDTLVYQTETDDEGLFSLRYLPAGTYDLVAYEDQNLNEAPDFAEPQDSTVVSLAPADTVLVLDLQLLQPDTTSATLASVVVEDSMTLVLSFDDFLDPDAPLDPVTVTVTSEEGYAPAVDRVLHAHELEAILREEAADAPSEAPAEVDTAGVPPLRPEAGRPEEQGGAEAGEPQSRTSTPLPGRELGVRLAEPLLAGVSYRLEVFDVTNINGVPGGGGEVEMVGPERIPEDDEGNDPPRPDSVPPASQPDAGARGR